MKFVSFIIYINVDEEHSLMIHSLTASRFSLPEDPPLDVVSIVSHAAQEYLKTLIEKLGVIADHRLENFKVQILL